MSLLKGCWVKAVLTAVISARVTAAGIMATAITSMASRGRSVRNARR